MRRVLWVLLFAPFCLEAESDPSIRLASDRGLRAIFAELVRGGGNGLRETEVAAFIVLDRGGYRGVIWPYTGAKRRQTYRGPMPRSTVAIAHTHHLSSVRPSRVDRQTAASLGVPVFVLTPTDIWVATPDGSTAAIVDRRWWMNGVEPPMRTERPPILALSAQ